MSFTPRYIATSLCLLAVCSAQSPLPVKWEELTAVDFVDAIRKSQGVCLLPIGILEKHGPHLPLGTDLINVRYVSQRGAQQEYAVVFPEYYFGQIFEARQEPGTIAYSARLQLELLQETADEMARNGCKKILIVNGHGGNNHLLPYFSQSQMASPKDYVVYVYQRGAYPPGRPPMKTKVDGHAGESETSHTLVSRKDLVRMDRAGTQSGADRNRLDLPPGVYTGIWWYAKFPDHYAGDGTAASLELGEFDMKAWADGVANAIRAVKADQNSLRLQDEFFEKSKRPLETPQ
ncbi:MAG: creatininase family protein [Acidobacteria bacterium]|nr:creatininase family protein [Acidobacteriota bacterium]